LHIFDDIDEDDQELNGVCAQFSKVILNVDEEERDEVAIRRSNKFGDSNIN